MELKRLLPIVSSEESTLATELSIPENIIDKVMRETPLAANEFLQLPAIDVNVQKAMDKMMIPQLASKLRAYDKDIVTIQAKNQ